MVNPPWLMETTQDEAKRMNLNNSVQPHPGNPGRREAAAFWLVDHRTIADPRLQAAQGQGATLNLR